MGSCLSKSCTARLNRVALSGCNNTKHGDPCVMKCRLPLVLEPNISKTLTCVSGSQWEGLPQQDACVQCTPGSAAYTCKAPEQQIWQNHHLNKITHASFDHCQNTDVGADCGFECAKYYLLLDASHNRILCNQDLNWSVPSPASLHGTRVHRTAVSHPARRPGGQPSGFTPTSTALQTCLWSHTVLKTLLNLSEPFISCVCTMNTVALTPIKIQTLNPNPNPNPNPNSNPNADPNPNLSPKG